ncbi:MAG: TRM11 family SAM-dependent methyltransferase [Candidatus Thorarchaeota archaeon]
MTAEDVLSEIFRAKTTGMSDEAIMRKFSVSLREIERAVVAHTGTNLNLFSTRRTIKQLEPKDFSLETTTVWSFKKRGNWATHNGNYRGNWSPYIPRNIILRYSEPGDLVLDQFCGGGTTAVEAKLLERRCIARDINPAAVELAKHNTDFGLSVQSTLDKVQGSIHEPQIEVGDARHLEGIEDDSVDLICTHPPYANIIHYTDGVEGDISFHDVDEFIEDMRTVARESYRVLKPGGVCAILIGDTRRKKRVVPIGFRTMRAFLEQRFVLRDLVIKRQHNCRTTGFWYSRSVKYNFLLLSHEYLPIFVKPPLDPSVVGDDTTCESTRFVTTDPTSVVGLSRLESKTTWVFEADRADELRDANVFARYGGSRHTVLSIEAGTDTDMVSIPEEQDLVYVKAFPESVATPSSYSGLISLAARTAAAAADVIHPGGHLVVVTRDLKRDGLTLSPAVDVWSRIEPPLALREIVVVSREFPEAKRGHHELRITHEYLLVYQKD